MRAPSGNPLRGVLRPVVALLLGALACAIQFQAPLSETAEVRDSSPRLDVLAESISPTWQRLPDETKSTRDSRPTDPSVVKDVVSALAVWLPQQGTPGELASRQNRSATAALLARVQSEWRPGWNANRSTALSIVGLAPAAQGLRWARSLRGPPA